MCLSLVIEILCKRHTNNLSREVSLISFEPERNYSVSGLLNNILELGTAAAALVKSDNVAHPHVADVSLRIGSAGYHFWRDEFIRNVTNYMTAEN